MTDVSTQSTDQFLNKITTLTQENQALQARVSALETQLSASQAAATEAQGKIKELETQLQSVTAEKDTFAQQLNEAQAKVTNLEQSFNELQSTATKATRELGIYKLISSDPKYHDILDVVDVLNLPDSLEDAKAVLDKMADKLDTARTTAAQTAAEALKSMGAPAGGGTNPPQNGPATADEALKMANEALARGDFAAFDSLTNKAIELSTPN